MTNKTPVPVICSPKDQVLNPEATVKAFSTMGSERKKIIPFAESGDPNQHVLAGNILSPATTEQVAGMILDFIGRK